MHGWWNTTIATRFFFSCGHQHILINIFVCAEAREKERERKKLLHQFHRLFDAYHLNPPNKSIHSGKMAMPSIANINSSDWMWLSIKLNPYCIYIFNIFGIFCTSKFPSNKIFNTLLDMRFSPNKCAKKWRHIWN